MSAADQFKSAAPLKDNSSVNPDEEKISPCPDAVEMSAYLEGRLNSAESRLIEDHLRDCASCAQAVEELRELLAGGEAEELDPETLERVKQRAKDLVGD